MALLTRHTSSLWSKQSWLSRRKRLMSDWSSRTYQLLQESPVPTDKFLKSLPRLPIPKLDQTCQRYLASQRVLLDDEAFAKTKKIVDTFQVSGKALDQQLRQVDKANKHTSYINKPWTEMYLKDRSPVAFTHNPGMKFIDDPRPEMQKQDLRAANMLVSSLRFFSSYRQGLLKPDVFHMAPSKTDNDKFWNKVKFFPKFMATPLAYAFKVFPLDMYQHPNLFQSTRIPCPGRDEIKKYPDAKHMLVTRRGHFYVFPVLDDNWNLFPPAYYLKALRTILQDNPPPSSEIGIFTSQNRDTWTQIRAHLVDQLGNGDKLELIDSALFNMVLDDDWTHDNSKKDVTVRNLVGGLDPTNRWFDKSFSLVFSTNGAAGMNFEHAWGDGVAVMRYIDEVIDDSANNDFVSNSGDFNADDIKIQRLDIKVDQKVKEAAAEAKRVFKAKCDSVTYHNFIIEGIGKEDCKKKNIGPDSFMQAGFQIAYYRLFGKFVATYESCSTAIFKHGRTETMRPCTLETAALTKAVESGASASDVIKLFQACSKSHFELTKLAAQGQGWDRHLFALRQLAAETGQEPPEIFKDPAYATINQNILSTSTLATTNMDGGAFCPVVPNGFGIGYQIKTNGLGAHLSSFKEHTNGAQMCQALEQTYHDLIKIMRAS